MASVKPEEVAGFAAGAVTFGVGEARTMAPGGRLAGEEPQLALPAPEPRLALPAPGGLGFQKNLPQTFFPPNNGSLGDAAPEFLYQGDRMNRFGGTDFSQFFSPVGTPPGARALPPGTADQPLRTFEVLKPFGVNGSTVAPAFGQTGLGKQYQTPVPLKTLLDKNIITEVKP
jgi:hypothetical protein